MKKPPVTAILSHKNSGNPGGKGLQLAGNSGIFGNFSVDENPGIGNNRNDMAEKRRQIRYPSHAQARIPEVVDSTVLLKDISVTGCGIESTMFMDIKLNHQYKIEILPEEVSKISPFELLVEVLWMRAGGYSFEAGFAIRESPKGKQFQRYVDYLSWR